MPPGSKDVVDLKKGWSLENEIEWTELYAARLERTLIYQKKRLEKMYSQREWWVRFLHYCNSNSFTLF